LNLTIWSKDHRSKILDALGVAIGGATDCRIDVVNDFTQLPPGNTVLCLGDEGLAFLKSLKVVPKNRTLTSLRNKAIPVGDAQYLLSYSPGILAVNYQMYVDLLCDARSALRVAITGKYKPILGHYEYVEDFSKVIAEIEAQYALTGKPVACSHDTETVGLDPVDPTKRFVTWQFSHKPGYSAVRYFSSMEDYRQALNAGLYDQIKWLMTTDKISMRMANGKFDLLWHWFHTRNLECTNFKVDTTLLGSCLDENRSNGLDVHAKIHSCIGGYSDEFDARIDKSRMDLLPKDQDLLEYAGGDTDACLQVSEEMKKLLLKDKKLTDFYVHVLHPSARAFEVIERGGIFIDMEAYNQLEFDLNKEIEALVKEAKGVIGGRLYAKHMNPEVVGGINLKKASLLFDFMFSNTGLGLKPKMFTEKSGEPSSTLEHMLMFKDVPEAKPFVDLLDRYGSATKTLSTYVTGFKEHIRSDGKFHPSYFLHAANKREKDEKGGTVTGRLSANSPAIQTVPKHTIWGKRIRRIFNTPPGWLMAEQDYSQGELRVVACIADEATMIQAYREKKDLHVLTGSGIVGMTYDEVIALKETDPDRYDAIRQPGKPANFGLLYGQFPEGFQVYAANNYGVELTLAQATEIREKFFKTYPGLVTYHNTTKAFAHKHGFVRSPLGRIRHLPLINSKNGGIKNGEERKAINSPVQATLSDMMIWAFALEHQQGGFKEAPAFAAIHDAGYSYLPEDNWEKHAIRKQEIMENLPFEKLGWKPQLKFIADTKVGKNMGDLYDLKKFKAMEKKVT